jgi:hypothetical protein
VVALPFGLLAGLPLEFLGWGALAGAYRGFAGGAAFAVFISLAERRHSLEDLSLRRVAIWGALGGGLLSLVSAPTLLTFGRPVGLVLVSLAANGLIGAGFASGSVALAKRADTDLLEGGDERRRAIEGG